MSEEKKKQIRLEYQMFRWGPLLMKTKITEEQRKQLLQYMWARPYGEVATHIAMLASLKPTESKKDDKPKKDLS